MHEQDVAVVGEDVQHPRVEDPRERSPRKTMPQVHGLEGDAIGDPDPALAGEPRGDALMLLPPSPLLQMRQHTPL